MFLKIAQPWQVEIPWYANNHYNNMTQQPHVPTVEEKIGMANTQAAASQTTATASNLAAGVEMGKKDAAEANKKAEEKKEEKP